MGAVRTSAPSASSAEAERSASSLGRVTTIRWPTSGSSSNQRSEGRRATTSPTTSSAGGPNPDATARRCRSPSVPTTVRCRGQRPRLDQRGGRRLGLAQADQRPAEALEAGHAHVDDQCPREPRQRLPVEPAERRGGFGIIVAGDEGDGRGRRRDASSGSPHKRSPRRPRSPPARPGIPGPPRGGARPPRHPARRRRDRPP